MAASQGRTSEVLTPKRLFGSECVCCASLARNCTNANSYRPKSISTVCYKYSREGQGCSYHRPSVNDGRPRGVWSCWVDRLGERLSGLFDVDASTAISLVTGGTSQPPRHIDHAYPIQVVDVHTFILQGHSKDVRLSRGILVPSFASHWGVVAGVPDALTLYHLIFDPDAHVPDDAVTDTIRGKRRAVKFNHTSWEDYSKKYGGSGKITLVGETKCSHEERIKIGAFPSFLTFDADWQFSREENDRSVRGLSSCVLELPNLRKMLSSSDLRRRG